MYYVVLPTKGKKVMRKKMESPHSIAGCKMKMPSRRSLSVTFIKKVHTHTRKLNSRVECSRNFTKSLLYMYACILLKLLGRCNTSGRPCYFFGILEFAILSKIVAIFPTKIYLTNLMFLAKMMSYFNF